MVAPIPTPTPPPWLGPLYPLLPAWCCVGAFLAAALLLDGAWEKVLLLCVVCPREVLWLPPLWCKGGVFCANCASARGPNIKPMPLTNIRIVCVFIFSFYLAREVNLQQKWVDYRAGLIDKRDLRGLHNPFVRTKDANDQASILRLRLAQRVPHGVNDVAAARGGIAKRPQ